MPKTMNRGNDSFLRALLTVVLVMLLCGVGWSDGSQPLLFVGDADYPPFSYSHNGVAEGFYIDLTQALSRQLKRPINIRIMDWQKAQQMVREGQVDALLGISASEDRAALYEFCDTAVMVEFTLFFREGTVGIVDLDDLEGKVVGVTAGGYPRRALEQYRKIKLRPVESYLEGINLLKKGAIDAFAGDKWVTSYHIQKNAIAGITLESAPFALRQNTFAVKKGNIVLQQEINRGLTELQSQGEIKRIKDKWMRQKVIYTTEESYRSWLFKIAAIPIVLILILLIIWIILLKLQINRRKSTEAALLQSEMRYRSMIQSMTEGFALHKMIYDENGKPADYVFLEVNPAFETLTGLKMENILGKTAKTVIPELEPYWIETYDQITRTGQSRHLEHFASALGKYYEVFAYKTTPDHFATFIIDITDREKAKAALQISEFRYRELFNHTSKCVVVYKPLDDGKDFIVVDLNTMAQETESSSREDVENRSIFSAFPNLRQMGVTEVMQRVFSTGVAETFPIAIRQKDRIVTWCEYYIYKLPSGEIITLYEYITDRKKMEEELRQSEEKYRNIVNNIVEGIFQCTPDGVYVNANQAQADLLGYTSPEELIGSVTDIATQIYVDPFQRDRYINLLKKDGRIKNFEFQAYRKDGSKLWISSNARTVTDTTGRILYFEGTNIDITTRKEAEEALRLSEEKFFKAFQNAPILFSIIDLKTGVFVDVNKELLQVSGYNRDDMIGHEAVKTGWNTPEHRKIFMGELKSKGRISNLEMAFRCRDGRVITGLVSGDLIQIADRNLLLTATIDITERKTAERRQEMITRILELLSSQKDVRSLIKNIITLIKDYTDFEAIGIRLKEGDDYPYFETVGFDDDFVEKERYLCSRDDSGQIIYDVNGNPYLECMCGNIIEGRTNPSLPFFTEGGSFWTNSTTKLLASTSDQDRQARTRNRCNGEDYESVALIPLKADKDLIGLLQLNDRRAGLFTLEMIHHLEGIGVSIGGSIQRIHAEEALQEAENRLQLTFDNASIGVCFVDLDGRVLKVNQEMSKILGYDREELESMTVNDIAHPDDREISASFIRKTLAGDHIDNVFYKRYIHKKGHFVYGRITSSLIKDKDHHPLYFISHVQDITNQRKMEERLQRAEKMEALGLLAGGVAHDLNNVIGISIGYSEMLLEDMEPGSPLRSHVVSIMQATERASAIVQDMLTMARRGVAVNQVVNLNTIISNVLDSPEIIKLLAVHPLVEIKTQREDQLLNISGSPIHLGKMILNLLTNAAEAIPQRGQILIESQNVYLDRPVKGYDIFAEGDYVVLSVSDTGEGISAENLQHIFEPFYTKKVMGRSGTGLGLSVVWGTVKDHSGYIDVTSEPGKGTTFSLYFPVCREEVTGVADIVDRAFYMGQGEKILVIDDVPEQRLLATRILNKLNYLTASVGSGEEAVEFVKKSKVNLVLLDMIMDPGIDGLETYRQILKICPGQRAVIVSGFAETNRVAEAQRLGAGTYVKKPYIMETLGLAVRRELDKKAAVEYSEGCAATQENQPDPIV